MPTEFVFVQGKAKWVRVHLPDQWQKYKVTLYPNQESLEKIRELQAEGVKNVLRKDEDGYNVTFNRPTSITVNGKVVGMAPPEVLQADGITPLKDIMIGNGSDVTLKLEVYSHRVPGTQGAKAKAARLLSVRVDNLVPFDGKHDFAEGEQRAVKGLDEQPKQLF